MSMKGQQEAIAVILISGILIGVVGSVYFWGVPLIQKNKDIAVLENSEKFVRNLNDKIKFVANNGGRDQLRLDLSGVVKFDPQQDYIQFIVDTKGTIYAVDAPIPLGKNADCLSTTGTFGVNDPETICVESSKISQDAYKTSYTLRYVNLENIDVNKKFLINLTGAMNVGGESSTIVFENKGNTQTYDGGRTLISTLIEISII